MYYNYVAQGNNSTNCGTGSEAKKKNKQKNPPLYFRNMMIKRKRYNKKFTKNEFKTLRILEFAIYTFYKRKKIKTPKKIPHHPTEAAPISCGYQSIMTTKFMFTSISTIRFTNINTGLIWL